MKNFLILLFFVIAYQLFSQSDIFWEREKKIVEKDIGDFRVIKNDKIVCVVYSELGDQFNLYVKYSDDGNIWSSQELLVKNFFSNNPRAIDFSACIDKDSNLYLCYRVNKQRFSIIRFSYPYKAQEYEKLLQVDSDNIIYLPYIFIDSQTNIHLLYSTSKENNFIILYKKINHLGRVISDNVISKDLKSAINPIVIENDGLLYMAFQAKDPSVESGYFYNIFLAFSKDYGKEWAIKRVVTSKGENNGGPFIRAFDNKIYMVWEKEDKNFISHIYYKTISLDYDNKEILVSSNNSEAHEPSIIKYGKMRYIFWYDNENGNFQNYFSPVIDNVNEDIFDSQALSNKTGRIITNKPTVLKNNLLLFYIQNKNSNELCMLKNDTYVASPMIYINNIPSSHLINYKNIRINWDEVKDDSGLQGYRAILTKNKDEDIDNKASLIYKEYSRDYKNLSDGTWYFKIKAYDNAGNISQASIFTFTIDTAKPEPPVIKDPHYDVDGALATNSPTIEWTDSNKPIKMAYYVYKLIPTQDWNDAIDYSMKFRDSDFKVITDRNIKFNNLENGILLIGIKGYDNANNLSDINWRHFTLNKFIATTSVNYVSNRVLANGESVFDIYGRGFKDNGDVASIFITKNKKEPYDYILDKNYFTVESDRLIRQTKDIKITDGSYYIGVEHPVRGVVFFDEQIKYYGEWLFSYKHLDYFNFSRVLFLNKEYNLTSLFFIALFIFWIAIFLIIFKAIVNILKEKAYVNHLLKEIDHFKTHIPAKEYKRRKEVMIKKGIGLTIKYTILIIALVFVIVTSTSFTISILTLRNETRNLANEMKERANLIIANYETTMKDIFTFEKGFTEAVDATVNITNLPDIGFAMFRQTDSTKFVKFGERSNVFFKKSNFNELTDQEKQDIISNIVFNKKTEEDINLLKNNYNGNPNIYPNFNSKDLMDSYVFLKPIIIQKKDAKIYIGEIVIGYSFEKILTLIKEETNNLIAITIFVTLIAIFISIFGAVFLATTTIRPIKRMSKHVNVISTIEDYEKLIGTENEKIEVRSGDEIGILASSINDMTSKLIEKAKADKQMMLGKEIQKKYITLEPLETDFIDIYGFYEGAKGVSGDYFDYKKLDEDHYAFIMCDVAGKAVPAALIMVQISTIFSAFCANIIAKKSKIETLGLINEINDTVAERGFTGRFAAIVIIILNIKTGKAIISNGGYTQLMVYKNSKKQAEIIPLYKDAPAVGVFPSYMLPHPYIQEELKIENGDIIFLFTDGIEEARNGKTFTNEKGEEHDEEFGLARIKNIFDKSFGRTPKEMIDELVAEEKKFRGNIEQYDDLTMLGIKRK